MRIEIALMILQQLAQILELILNYPRQHIVIYQDINPHAFLYYVQVKCVKLLNQTSVMPYAGFWGQSALIIN